MDDAFLNAIGNYSDFLPEYDGLLDDDLLLCECNCVSVSLLRKELSNISGKSINPDILKQKLGIGTGCGKCLEAFESWKSRVF